MKDKGAHAWGLASQPSAVPPAASLSPQEGFSAAHLPLVGPGSSEPGRERPACCRHPPCPAETRRGSKAGLVLHCVLGGARWHLFPAWVGSSIVFLSRQLMEASLLPSMRFQICPVQRLQFLGLGGQMCDEWLTSPLFHFALGSENYVISLLGGDDAGTDSWRINRNFPDIKGKEGAERVSWKDGTAWTSVWSMKLYHT